jgi:hypothetical protein
MLDLAIVGRSIAGCNNLFFIKVDLAQGLTLP